MSSSPKWECDVFVSFKSGGDQVDNFTSNLFKRLDQVGIRYFRDDNGEKAPENFKGNRDEALKQVRFALVVFCESYVNSRCHHGLVELLNRKKDPKLVVIPIYFTDRAAPPPTFAEALRTKAVEISGYVLRAANGDRLENLIDKTVKRLVNEIRSLYTRKDFGPFGGKGGELSCSGKINGISIVYNNGCIKSIAFEVKHDTDNKQQKDSPREVKFGDGEYITFFAGYFDNDKKRINSLEFRTNRRSKLGPFGKKEGEYFSLPPEGWKVTEFFVGENDFLTSIGARVERDSKKFLPVNVQRVGFIGQKFLLKWDDGHHHAKVSKIIVNHDSSRVQSIKFEYEEKDGKSRLSETHGLDGNNFTTHPIEMGPHENLTSISAVCKGDDIKALKFQTNERDIQINSVEQAVRNEGNTPVQLLKPEGRIVGFYGWSRERLCGIGAYAERKSFESEAAWKDKEYFGVREIGLIVDHRDPLCAPIRYIRFVYDNGSEKGYPIEHGGPIGEGLRGEEKVILDYPHEYLTSISGYKGNDDSIQSLTFYSNRKTYGPYYSFVKEKSKYFWYPSTGSRITGFYGTSDGTLKSIGVYAEDIPHIYPFKTIGPVGGLQGVEWDDEKHTDIRAFRVSYNNHRLHSISFMYDDKGSLVEGRKHGGGDAGEWIWLDFPNERLSSITVWKDENEPIISHLKITTTKGLSCSETHGPYPSREPNSQAVQYDIDLAGHNKTVGFFGRAGESYLNAIGAHLKQN